MTNRTRARAPRSPARLAAAGLSLLLFCSCGGRPRASRPAAEAPDLHTALLTCNVDRVKELVDANPFLIDTPQTLAKDPMWNIMNRPSPAYEMYPVEQAAQSMRLCGAGNLEYLLEHDPLPKVVVLNRALQWAWTTKHPELLPVLLQHGADPNEPEPPTRQSMLRLAALLPFRHAFARALIEAGAKEDIYVAAGLNDVAQVRALLRRDSSLADQREWPDDPQYKGLLPIEYAFHPYSHPLIRRKEAVDVLLDYMKDPDLASIVASGDAWRVRDYLDHHPGAVRGIRGAYDSAFGMAVISGDVEIARLFIERGADVTDFHVMFGAIGSERAAEMVQLLIDAGADVHETTTHTSYLKMALTARKYDVADIIRRAQ